MTKVSDAARKPHSLTNEPEGSSASPTRGALAARTCLIARLVIRPIVPICEGGSPCAHRSGDRAARFREYDCSVGEADQNLFNPLTTRLRRLLQVSPPG